MLLTFAQYTSMDLHSSYLNPGGKDALGVKSLSGKSQSSSITYTFPRGSEAYNPIAGLA